MRQLHQCQHSAYFPFYLNPDKSLGLLEFANMGRGRTECVRGRWAWWCQFWRVGLNFTPSVIHLFLFLSARHLCAHYCYPLPGSVLIWSLSYFTFLWSSVQICSSNWMTAESFCEVIRFKKKNATFTWLSVNRFSAVYKCLDVVEVIIVNEVWKLLAKL